MFPLTHIRTDIICVYTYTNTIGSIASTNAELIEVFISNIKETVCVYPKVKCVYRKVKKYAREEECLCSVNLLGQSIHTYMCIYIYIYREDFKH